MRFGSLCLLAAADETGLNICSGRLEFVRWAFGDAERSPRLAISDAFRRAESSSWTFFFHIHQAESPVLPFVSGCDPWQEAWRQKPETGRVQYPLVVYKGSVHIEASREDEGDKVEDFTG